MDQGAAPVELPLEDTLDLHSFAPRDIPDVVEEYLKAARAAGFAEVRLIHGRGQGVQRGRIHALLARPQRRVGADGAPPARGGGGATVAVPEPAKGEGPESPD